MKRKYLVDTNEQGWKPGTKETTFYRQYYNRIKNV